MIDSQAIKIKSDTVPEPDQSREDETSTLTESRDISSQWLTYRMESPGRSVGLGAEALVADGLIAVSTCPGSGADLPVIPW